MNAPTLFTHRQRHDHKLRAAELALVQAMQTVSGLALNLRDGDLDAANPIDRAGVVNDARAFERALLAWREAAAATARVPDADSVEDAESFECGLLAALERHFGTADDDGPRLGPSDCLEPGYATGAGRR